MGIATFPAGSSGISTVIRSIQRGIAASAGNITITSVDTTKTICNSFSTSSSGTVAASGALSAPTGTASAQSGSTGTQSGAYGPFVLAGAAIYHSPGAGSRYQGATNMPLNLNAGSMNVNAQNISLNATNLSGGTTNLVSAVFGVHLINSTTITATGPCRYEVIEYI
jgi:hypothetical protein